MRPRRWMWALVLTAACVGSDGVDRNGASLGVAASPGAGADQFETGFPLEGTAPQVYDTSDLRRAIEAYKTFVPTLATEAVIQQMANQGARPNGMGMVMATSPRQQFQARTRTHRTRLRRWTSGPARWWSRCPPTLCCSASSTITT